MTNVTYVQKLPLCDICGADAHFDARTVRDVWANLCDLHFGEFGIGLGTGIGQMLKVREEVVEVSVEGEIVSFDSWMKDVSYELARSVGLSPDDLIDTPYYDWYERGVVASDAAESTVERAMDW